MPVLQGKHVVVMGASAGVGREIVAAARAEGAEVLAVARRPEPLARLAADLPGVSILSADATDEDAPGRVFEAMPPDILVLCGGAHPVMTPIKDIGWEAFSVAWNTDAKASFFFCQAAMRRPLPPGSTVIMISSGAALGGSQLSGSYAAAKRMQMFLAEYCQKQADRMNLGIRFLTLLPMRIMPGTGVGQTAIEGYSRFLGISEAEFMEGMADQTPAQVAEGVVRLASGDIPGEGSLFKATSAGVEALS